MDITDTRPVPNSPEDGISPNRKRPLSDIDEEEHPRQRPRSENAETPDEFTDSSEESEDEFNLDTLDVKVPLFDIKQAVGSERHLVFDPPAPSAKTPSELSKESNIASRILTLRIPYDEPEGVLGYFQQFQAAYYLLWLAAHLSASSKNLDISCHLLVVKEDTQSRDASSGMHHDTHPSLFSILKDSVANKKFGFYLAEIHFHDIAAQAGFTEAMRNCQSLFQTREVKDMGPSAMMQLQNTLAQHYTKAETQDLVLFQCKEDFSRGVVLLGEYQNTIQGGRHMHKKYRAASVADILHPFVVEYDAEQPPNIVSCEPNDNFMTLVSRENVFRNLLPPDTEKLFHDAYVDNGHVFIDRYKAYPLGFNNIKNLVAYKDCPGSATHWLTKLLINQNHRRCFYQETYIDNAAGLKFLDELVLEQGALLDGDKRLDLIRRYFAGNHPLMEAYALNLRETLMYMFSAVNAGTKPENMNFYVTKLTKEETNGCRVGSVYLKQLWFMVDKYEHTCKLHSIRVVLQYLRDLVFFHEVTSRDPPGANLFGDAGGGKSHLFNMVKSCSLNGMFEDCAWESRQGGLRNCGKKIKLNHEGKPSKQVKNGNNEAEMSLEKVGHSQGRTEPLEVHRMGSDGKPVVVHFKNLQKNWSAVNFAKTLIPEPILARAINKSTNAQTPPGRNVSAYVQEAASTVSKERMNIAHDENRFRFFFFLGYDTMDSMMNKEQDSTLFSWVISQIGSDVHEFELQGLLSGARENTYTYLISRVHTLHSVVTALFYDLAVPDAETLFALEDLARTPDQKNVTSYLRDMCTVTRDNSGEIATATPISFMERFMSQGDCLIAECLMFQTLDSICFGIASQTDPHMQNDIKIVKQALKTLCQEYGKFADKKALAKYKIASEDDDIKSEYAFLEMSKDALLTMITQVLRQERVVRSEATIECALQFLYTHVVHDETGSNATLAIKYSQVNGVAIFFDKKLFNGILTRNEHECIGYIMDDIHNKITEESHPLDRLYESNKELWMELIIRRMGLLRSKRLSEKDDPSYSRGKLKSNLKITEPELIILERRLGKDETSRIAKDNPHELKNILLDEDFKRDTNRIRFLLDVGISWMFYPAATECSKCREGFSKKITRLAGSLKNCRKDDLALFWESLDNTTMFSLVNYLDATEGRVEQDWSAFLNAESLRVIYDRQQNLSKCGILRVNTAWIGKGDGVQDKYRGNPSRGIKFSTKESGFRKVIGSGEFSSFNDPSNIRKEHADLIISRKILGLFETTGKSKNPIHTGIESMMSRLNITSDEQPQEHFYLSEPLEKNSLELGRVNVPLPPEKNSNAAPTDIEIFNVGYFSVSKKANMSTRMAKSFRGDTRTSLKKLKKLAEMNPEEEANLAWFKNCRIYKMLFMNCTCKESRKNALKMATIIYTKIASYRAVNKKLRQRENMQLH